jgi:hypothetical protein
VGDKYVFCTAEAACNAEKSLCFSFFPLKWRLFLSHTHSTPREFSRLTTQTKFSFYKLEQRLLHEFIRTTSLDFSILQIDGTTPSEKPYFTSYQDIEHLPEYFIFFLLLTNSINININNHINF